PYADLRKWVQSQLEETRARSRVVHRDSISVQREGAAQIAFVGPPNAGKSSLLQSLSNIQIKTGDYAFTTTRPVPALTRIRDVLREAIWNRAGLIRVFLRRPGDDEAEPLALRPPATIIDVARTIHQEVADECRGARVWGPSARFEGQRVGREHLVADGDTIE